MMIDGLGLVARANVGTGSRSVVTHTASSRPSHTRRKPRQPEGPPPRLSTFAEPSPRHDCSGRLGGAGQRARLLPEDSIVGRIGGHTFMRVLWTARRRGLSVARPAHDLEGPSDQHGKDWTVPVLIGVVGMPRCRALVLRGAHEGSEGKCDKPPPENVRPHKPHKCKRRERASERASRKPERSSYICRSL